MDGSRVMVLEVGLACLCDSTAKAYLLAYARFRHVKL